MFILLKSHIKFVFKEFISYQQNISSKAVQGVNIFQVAETVFTKET